MKKKPVFWIGIALITIMIVAGTLFFKQYYDNRYVEDDVFYTVVPPDYDYTPEISYSSKGEKSGYHKDYNLKCYNANGEERVLEFRVRLNLQELYPPGTYVKVSVSKAVVLRQNALAEANVPEAALVRIKEGYMPSSASTLIEYADERTGQLSARNTPSLTVTCAANETSLTYTYTYGVGAKEFAQEMAELLDPVYRAQFRTDNEAFPEIDAIFLEIKLDDGTVIFSQKYSEIVRFGYEING